VVIDLAVCQFKKQIQTW